MKIIIIIIIAVARRNVELKWGEKKQRTYL